MLKNMFKERITECAFDNEVLFEVYEMICNLEMPYIWYTDNFNGEQLYLINDIETQNDVKSYSWQIDDIEFMGPMLDVIGLTLCRMSGKKIEKKYMSISRRSNLTEKDITAQALLKRAGFRIPDISEYDSVNFTNDIPGNKKDVDEELNRERIKYLKKSIEENESNVEMNRKKREVLESVIKNLQFDIKRCDYTIANANQRIEKGDYNPTINLCISICKVLNKSLDELFWTE